MAPPVVKAVENEKWVFPRVPGIKKYALCLDAEIRGDNLLSEI